MLHGAPPSPPKRMTRGNFLFTSRQNILKLNLKFAPYEATYRSQYVDYVLIPL